MFASDLIVEILIGSVPEVVSIVVVIIYIYTQHKFKKEELGKESRRNEIMAEIEASDQFRNDLIEMVKQQEERLNLRLNAEKELKSEIKELKKELSEVRDSNVKLMGDNIKLRAEVEMLRIRIETLKIKLSVPNLRSDELNSLLGEINDNN